MTVTTGSSDALTRYLDMFNSQMKLTASNLANRDTPEILTVGIDFNQELQSQLTFGGTAAQAQVEDAGGLAARPDGTHVSVDHETLQMAQTQLQFKIGIEVLRHQFTRISDAIHASDGK